jgi:transcriptional regulator
MYQPAAFREDRPDVLRALVRSHPLGTLVTQRAPEPGSPPGAWPVLQAHPVPFVLAPEGATAPGGTTVLWAHVARANPAWEELAAMAAAGAECLVVFQGPQAYVSPGWYPSKAVDGRVVPTWNYATVHAWCRPTLHDDPAWVATQLRLLTAQQEAALPRPWAVDDAPADFLARLQGAIVGLELVVSRMEGKWKVSQNRPAADRDGVVQGLLAQEPASGAAAMAALVRERENQ